MHLFIDIKTEKNVACASLRNYSISLELEERDSMNMSYTTVPAVKIARLGAFADYQGLG